MSNTMPTAEALYLTASGLIQKLADKQVDSICAGAMGAAVSGTPIDPTLSAEILNKYATENGITNLAESEIRAIICRQALSIIQTSANALPKSGGTMTGAITLAADPAADYQPSTRNYSRMMGLDSIIGSMTLSDSINIPIGSLDNFLTAVRNGAATVTFWTDSRGLGWDQVEQSRSTTYIYRFQQALKDKFPNCTFTFVQRSLGGRSLHQAVNASYVATCGTTDCASTNWATGYGASWATNGVAWRTSVKDTGPDLVVVDFGMNDAGSGADYSANSNLTTLLAYIATWTKPCDLLLCTTYATTGEGRSEVALRALTVAYRRWAKRNNVALADVGLVARLYFYGDKDDEPFGTRIDTMTSDFGAPTGSHWLGDTNKWTLSGGVLAPNTTGAAFIFRTETHRNGTLQCDLKVQTGSTGWILFRENGEDAGGLNTSVDGTKLGGLVLNCTANSGADGSTTGSLNLYYVLPGFNNQGIFGSAIVNWNGNSTHTIRIEFFEDEIKVFMDDLVTPKISVTGSFRCLHDGRIGFGTQLSLLPSMSNFVYVPGYAVGHTVPVTTQPTMLGASGGVYGGNGGAHPNSIGHALMYGAVLREFVARLPVT